MTTTLDIINHILSVVDEAPVSDPASLHPTVQSINAELSRVNRQIQARGWYFNKELNLTLLPDANGFIILPSNTLKVVPASSIKMIENDIRSKFVRRGNKLYDPRNHTFAIGISVPVDLTVQLAIEDLPETAAYAIQAKCAYNFYVNDDGDEAKATRLKEEMAFCWQQLNSEELNASNVTTNDRPLSMLLKAGIRQYGNSYSGNPLFPGGR